ncbi:MAG TPA: aldehyde dehydrogenase, partial [Holophagaceae bacterium]|nr:aldehyde dehydrogenase [Holophagaceae bacterium]
MSVPELRNFVNGAFVAAKDGELLDNLGPATGEIVARIPRSTKADVDAAVAAAKAALPGWAKTSVAERAALLDRVADRIEARLDELAALESRDTGKPISLAKSLDIPRAIANFRFFADLVRTQPGESSAMADALNYTHRAPAGVCALITPWNLPLYLLSWKTAPALAMGNTIVAKPSELTPMTASVLAEILMEAGCPPGVFNLIHGLGAEAGDALVSHPDVALVSFTGGTATGAKVAATAAPQFKKLSLELGGKNPSLVFADCDFDKTVQGVVRAAFLNQGQICLCGSRVLVERPLHDRFVDALLKELKAWPVGDPSDPTTKIGATISDGHRDKVEGYLKLATEEGGTVRCGGKRPNLPAPFDHGFFLEPTIITGLSAICRTATEEIFGPVVTVHPFDTEEEALQMANGTKYGLAASVWTSDLKRAHRVSQALESGMVWVNTWLH